MSKRLLAVVLLLPLWLGGCAMKGDIRDLQDDIGDLEASQQRMLAELRRQNEEIIASLEAQDARLRGDLLAQLVQIERQLVQIQELTGQGQQRLAELRETLQRREQALRAAPAPANGDAPPPADAGDPTELFETAAAALERGSMSTARVGLEEFIRVFPDEPQAPEARLQLASILAQDDDEDGALEQYSQILELHPNSTQAASALFRAALIERDRGNDERAESMLNQLTAAYPSSPEAEEARDLLRRRR